MLDETTEAAPVEVEPEIEVEPDPTDDEPEGDEPDEDQGDDDESTDDEREVEPEPPAPPEPTQAERLAAAWERLDHCIRVNDPAAGIRALVGVLRAAGLDPRPGK